MRLPDHASVDEGAAPGDQAGAENRMLESSLKFRGREEGGGRRRGDGQGEGTSENRGKFVKLET